MHPLTKARFVKAYWPWTWLLNGLGLAGIVMPWRSIYYLEPWQKSPEFIRHELVHIEQIDRLGPIRFSVLYLYYLARYGYRNSPLEREAYACESQSQAHVQGSPEVQGRPQGQGQDAVSAHG